VPRLPPHEGHIPPGIFEDILSNFSGIANQTAKLAKQKYEVKLNKWVRSEVQQDDSPPIGITSNPSPPSRSSRPTSSKRRQTQNVSGGGQPSQGGQKPSESEKARRSKRRETPSSVEEVRKKRRVQRVNRRSDIIDQAAREFADEAASEFASEFTGMFGDMRDVAYTFFKRKAEKDPDWLFEKMEKWDMDMLDVLLEPSEARKEEMGEGGSKPEADQEIDAAMEEVMGGSKEPQQPTETTNTNGQQEPGGEIFNETQGESAASERTEKDIQEGEQQDPFEEQFGDLGSVE